MSNDAREDILNQIFTLMQAVPGVTTVWRNRGEIPDEAKLPSIIVLDGKEESTTPIENLKAVRQPPLIMRLQPQIWYVAQPRSTPENLTLNGSAAPIGPELSAYRMAIMTALVNDPVLLSMLGPNGQIDYRGSETDMAGGASMVGVMMLQFEFRYVLPPPRP